MDIRIKFHFKPESSEEREAILDIRNKFIAAVDMYVDSFWTRERDVNNGKHSSELDANVDDIAYEHAKAMVALAWRCGDNVKPKPTMHKLHISDSIVTFTEDGTIIVTFPLNPTEADINTTTDRVFDIIGCPFIDFNNIDEKIMTAQETLLRYYEEKRKKNKKAVT